MPKHLGEFKYCMGWDYCAAQLERLGYIGDAYEIYRLHLGKEGEWVFSRIPAFVVARNISPLVFLQTNMFVIAGLRMNNSLRFFATGAIHIILAVLIARIGALISQVMTTSLTVTLTVTAHIGVIADTS
jgi:hypothetical protein